MNLIQFALLIGATHATLTLFSYSCPTGVSSQSSFDQNSYLGIWYEVQSDSWDFLGLRGKCYRANYTALDDGDIQVVYRAEWSATSNWKVEGKARAASGGSGDLAVNFNPFSDAALAGDSSYHILSTDYSSYALVYECIVGFLGIEQYVYFFSRR